MSVRESIRAAKRHRVAVDVSGWGVRVYARALSARERIEWERRCTQKKKPNGESDTAFAAALLLVMAVEDEAGTPVFDEVAGDLEWLQQEAGAPDVFQVYDKAADLNALSKGKQEELGKNSETGQTNASPTS